MASAAKKSRGQCNSSLWTKDKTLELIALFKSRSDLWNVSSELYSNRNHKQNLQGEIAEKLEIDATEVAAKLHNLRCQYNAELRKLKVKKCGSGTEKLHVPRWEFFNALKFLTNGGQSFSTTSNLLPNQITMDSQLEKHETELKNLLSTWELEHHYEHFVKQKITIKHLRLLQPKHIDKLFQIRPIGDQVMFEHHLEIWKMTMLLNNDFSSSSSISNTKTTSVTTVTPHRTTITEQRNESPAPLVTLSDTPRDMDLLVANESNDSDDSFEEEANDFISSSFNISAPTPTQQNSTPTPTLQNSTPTPTLLIPTPTPRVVLATPRTVQPAALAPLPRHSHTASVPSFAAAVAAPVAVAPVREPIQMKSFTNPILCRYDLMQILTETSGGQLVLNYYSKHQHLREEHRTALINVIARYIDANGCTLTLSESNQLESQIVQMFPTEKEEFYRTSKRGRLYNKVANMKRIYKKFSKDIEGTSTTQMSGPSSPSPSSSSTGVIKEEEYVDEYNEYIVHDLRAKAQATGNFLEFWKSTQPMRMKNIDEIEYLQEILEKWPEYKELDMIEYISMDFYDKHPTATQFSQVFHDSIGKLEKLLFTKVSTCSAAFKNLQLYQKATKESQHLIILWVIHQIFPPNHHMAVDEHGIKRKKRYSILDSQNACVCIRSSMALIDNYLHNKGTATPPMLLVVGELGLDIQEVFVYFEGVRYPVNSVVNAAELCLQLFFLFNIDFPEEALLYYNFMQTYFMNIEPDVKNSKIYTTINDLNAY